MEFKYKITDVAKDFGVPNKKIIDTLAAVTGETKKTGGTVDEQELNYLLEQLTRETAEASLDAYFASAHEAPAEKPAPKAAKAAKPAAPQPAQPKAQPPKEEAKQPAAQQQKPRQPEHKRQPERPAEKRKEKRVTMQALAADTGVKQPVTTETVEVQRAHVQVDTRTVDVNVDKFSARYDDLADSRNMPAKRKNQPVGNKQKFNNKNRGRNQYQRRRETEAERLQRIQLEKARNAQLKISIPDEITVSELASRLKQNVAKVVAKFMQMGEMHAASDVVDFDTAALVAEEFHAKVEHEVHVSIEERLFEKDEDNEADLVTRPPVVVVMGHVDHGKTSILDAIRKTNVTAGEAGGITQAIGAYQVKSGDSVITFLDTPGHEAFTAMRARGAELTDVAILVVAADDGVMPQTVEAINHAQAAHVPIVVAVNKIDVPGANPEKVRGQLTEFGLVPEEYGGDTMFVDISAKQGTNVDKLLEAVLLTADAELDLRANPDMDARGATVEARLDKGRGAVATVLVQQGTLHVGDAIVAGTSYGRVRAMLDENGNQMKEAVPSTPVQVLGLTSVPTAGDLFLVAPDDRTARQIAEKRQATERAAQLAKRRKIVSLESLKEQFAKSEVDMLNIVIKGDSSGSVEALEDSLMKIEVSDEVGIQVIHRGVGAITQNDVNLATVDKAVIIGFNVRPNRQVAELAEREGVEIKYYSIIYKAIEDIEASLKGMLKPEYEEVVTSHSEIREIFRSSKFGNIAGVMVQDGEVKRGTKCRILRNGVATVNDLEISSLRRFKDDVTSVKEGYEAGINLGSFNDIEIGDIIETFEMQEVERK